MDRERCVLYPIFQKTFASRDATKLHQQICYCSANQGTTHTRNLGRDWGTGARLEQTVGHPHTPPPPAPAPSQLLHRHPPTTRMLTSPVILFPTSDPAHQPSSTTRSGGLPSASAGPATTPRASCRSTDNESTQQPQTLNLKAAGGGGEVEEEPGEQGPPVNVTGGGARRELTVRVPES